MSAFQFPHPSRVPFQLLREQTPTDLDPRVARAMHKVCLCVLQPAPALADLGPPSDEASASGTLQASNSEKSTEDGKKALSDGHSPLQSKQLDDRPIARTLAPVLLPHMCLMCFGWDDQERAVVMSSRRTSEKVSLIKQAAGFASILLHDFEIKKSGSPTNKQKSTANGQDASMDPDKARSPNEKRESPKVSATTRSSKDGQPDGAPANPLPGVAGYASSKSIPSSSPRTPSQHSEHKDAEAEETEKKEETTANQQAQQDEDEHGTFSINMHVRFEVLGKGSELGDSSDEKFDSDRFARLRDVLERNKNQDEYFPMSADTHCLLVGQVLACDLVDLRDKPVHWRRPGLALE